MRFFKEMAEEARASRLVLMPNRYAEPFIEAFQSLTGEEVPELPERKAKVKSNNRTYWFTRGRDIPQIVESVKAQKPNSRTIGVTSSEWCAEFVAAKPNTPVVFDTISKKAIGALALIAPEESDIQTVWEQLVRYKEPVGVVTPYQNLTARLAVTSGLNFVAAEVVNGGVEGAADILAIPAIDLVCSGETVQINGFTILKELVSVYPALVTQSPYVPFRYSSVDGVRYA